jgi:hypothetical protein
MHDLQVHYRPDNYPFWVPWKSFSDEFTMVGEIGSIDAGGNPVARAGFAPRVSLGKPGNDCDPTTGRRLRRGYHFQIKFTGTGHVILDKFRLHAMRLVEKSTANPTPHA